MKLYYSFMTLAYTGAIICAYLWGSFPTGFILVRLKLGKDIRTYGSGNIGATNVSRVLGKGWALVAFLGDSLKGFWPLLFVREQLGWEQTWILSSMGFASVLGHCYCPWLGFRGGKGVAVAAGVLLNLCPFAAIAGLGAYLMTISVTKVSAIGSMVGLIVTLFAIASFAAQWLPFVAAVGLIIVWRHRSNFSLLLAKKNGK